MYISARSTYLRSVIPEDCMKHYRAEVGQDIMKKLSGRTSTCKQLLDSYHRVGISDYGIPVKRNEHEAAINASANIRKVNNNSATSTRNVYRLLLLVE